MEYTYFPDKADFSVTLLDDSMSPTIRKGDELALREPEVVNGGDIVLVRVDDQEMVRRIYSYPDKTVLLPENTRYEPTVLLGNENLQIEGIVVGTYHRLKEEQ